MVQTSDGGYALVGGILEPGERYSKGIIQVTDENGDSLWFGSHPEFGYDCYTIMQTEDDGYAIMGNFPSWGPQGTGIKRINQHGDSLWYSPFGDGDDRRVHEWCRSAIATSDSNFAMIGFKDTSLGHGVGTVVFKLVMIDGNGDFLWSNRYSLNDNEKGKSIVETEDGGFALMGEIFGDDQWGTWFVRVDAEGDSLLSRTYEGRYADIITTENGGFQLTRADGILLRTDDRGDSLWSLNLELESEYDQIITGMQTKDGSYVFSGNDVDGNILVIRTSRDPVSVPSENISILSGDLTLGPAYPNPFNAQTTLSFSLPHPGSVSVDVYNLTGRRIQSWGDVQFAAGQHRIIWSPQQLPSGSYFIRLSASDEVRTNKVTLLK